MHHLLRGYHKPSHALIKASLVRIARPSPELVGVVRDFQSSPVCPGGRKGGASAFMKKARSHPSQGRNAIGRTKQPQGQRHKKPNRIILGDRGEAIKSLQLPDEESLIDPEFEEVVAELLRSDVEHPMDLRRELRKMDPDRKAQSMHQREITTGRPCLTEEYNKLIRIYGAHGRYDDAYKIVQDMASRDVPLTAATTTSLVTVAGWAGQPERAKEIMSEMESLGVASNEQAWAALVHTYARHGRVDEAMDVANQMKLAGFPKDVVVCTSLLYAMYKAGPHTRDQMMDFWMDMRLDNVEPDVVAYTVMMRAWCRTGAVERTLSFLDEMTDLGVEPNLYTFNTILSAASQSPLWFPGYNDFVYEILGRLEAANIQPNQVTYNTLIQLCGRAGNSWLAERYLAKMKLDGIEPSVATYIKLLDAYGRAQSAGAKGGIIPPSSAVAKHEGAEDEEYGNRIKDSLGQEIDLRSLSRGVKKKGSKKGKQEEENAKRLLSSSRSQGLDKLELSLSDLGVVDPELRKDEGDSLIGEDGPATDDDKVEEKALRLGDLELVKAQGLRHGLTEPLPTDKPSSVVFEGLVPFDVRQGLENANRLHLVKSRLPRGWTLERLQDRNMIACGEVLKEMKAQGLSITTPVLNSALKVYAEALRLNRAMQFMNKDFAEHRVVPNDQTYEVIMRMLVRAKRLQGGIDLLEDMKDKGIKPNCNTLGTLIDAFGRRGHIKPALYLLEVMVEDLKMQPKEWHVTALRRVMVKRQLQHPLIPPDPKAWLAKGMEIRKSKKMKDRRMTNLVSSQLQSIMG